MVATPPMGMSTQVTTIVFRGRRVELVRHGARLIVRALGPALTEAEARTVSTQHLAEGERLLDCVERAGGSPHSRAYTFVIWPKMVAHTGRLLDSLPNAA